MNWVIVLGSINVDLVIRGPKLPAPGQTVLGGNYFQTHGGKGANQAVAAARASLHPVTFLAAVGDDELGRQSLAALDQENLRCEWIKRVAGAPTGVALILVDERGENLISVASGANLQLLPEDVDAVGEDAWQQAGVFLASAESPLGAIERGLQKARQFDVKTIFNPAPVVDAAEMRCLLPLVDVATPNEFEAGQLTGINAVDVDAAIQAGLELRRLGCAAAVITLGPRGCVVIEEHPVHIAAERVQAVDTTAAGDQFNGALAVALAEGRSLVDAARWANRAAAISVTRAGAQPSLCRRKEVDAADT